MKLNLGFEDHAYEARYSESSPLTKAVKKAAPKRPTRAQMAYGQGKTTAEVAAELEAKYSIVETFVELEEDNITELLEDAYGEHLEAIMSMESVPKEIVTSKQTDKIEANFRKALSSRRFDGVISGVPTTAAQRGVSHLRQHPYAKRPPRPSFIDTGMYQRSFRAWVEDTEEEE